VCDVAYVLLVEQNERLTYAAMAAGSEEADLGVARDRLDQALVAPLGYRDAHDRERAELLTALGLEAR
jgi:hypothetical protein